jgi:hypothetical protein
MAANSSVVGKQFRPPAEKGPAALQGIGQSAGEVNRMTNLPDRQEKLYGGSVATLRRAGKETET